MSHNNTEKEGYKKTTLGWIPNEWEVRKLREISREGRLGGNYENSEENEGTPVIKMGNIDRGFIKIDKIQCLPMNYQFNDEDILKEGDLLFNTRNTLELVGKVAIWRNELRFALYNSNLMRIKFKEEFITSNWFMNYAFNSTNSIRQLKGVATGTTSVAAIYGRDLNHIKFFVPPFTEQKKIAAILSTWDAAITKTQLLIAQLQLRNKGLMQELLKPKEGWKKFRIGDLIEEIKRPVEWNDDECYDLISVRRRSGGAFYRDSLKGGQILTKQLLTVYENDFLFSKMQIVHGASSIVPKELSGMKVSGSYITVKTKDETKLDIQYFNWVSKARFFYRLTFLSSHGVHIEKMTFDFDDFKQHKISLPKLLSEQKRTVQILNKAADEVKKLEQKLAALQLQKKGLMQKLLTGEVRVKI